MSITCEAYIGWTVTLKENLNSNDFDFFNEFCEQHNEYNQYDCKGKVLLSIDGMSGHYARLIYVDEYIKECWIEENKNYFSLKNPSIPDDIYSVLNEAYRLLYDKDLDKNLVEYALWFHFS